MGEDVREVRILLLEEDAVWRQVLIRSLESRPATFVLASRYDPPSQNPEDAKRYVREFRPHCAIISWGYGFGYRMAPALREEDPHLPVAVLSGHPSEQLEGVGANEVFSKADGLEVIQKIWEFAVMAAEWRRPRLASTRLARP